MLALPQLIDGVASCRALLVGDGSSEQQRFSHCEHCLKIPREGHHTRTANTRTASTAQHSTAQHSTTCLRWWSLRSGLQQHVNL